MNEGFLLKVGRSLTQFDGCCHPVALALLLMFPTPSARIASPLTLPYHRTRICSLSMRLRAISHQASETHPPRRVIDC